MFATLALALTIMGAASSAYSAYQQYQAADEAEKMGERNEQREMEMAEEEASRATKQAEIDQSKARAGFAQAGFEQEGTPDLYLGAMQDVSAHNVAWIMKSGRTRAKIAKEEGESAARDLRAGAVGSLASSFLGMAGGFSQYGQATMNPSSPGRIK